MYYSYLGPALRALRPLDAVHALYPHPDDERHFIVIRLKRPPRSRWERWNLEGALRREPVAVSWALGMPPEGQAYLVVRLRTDSTPAERNAFRDGLGLRYRWYGGLVDQDSSGGIVRVGESLDRWRWDETYRRPDPDVPRLGRVPGVSFLAWDYERAELTVEVTSGWPILLTLMRVCDAADAYLDIESFQPPDDWDRRTVFSQSREALR